MVFPVHYGQKSYCLGLGIHRPSGSRQKVFGFVRDLCSHHGKVGVKEREKGERGGTSV